MNPIEAVPDSSAVAGILLNSNPAAAIREFLAFKLGDEEYGIDILRVQEIRSYEPPTRMANTPAFLKGVINLRGVIVPSWTCASSSTWNVSAMTRSPS